MAHPRWLSDQKVEFTSPLPPEECLRRLQAFLDGDLTSLQESPVIGRVGSVSFSLRKRLAPTSHNSFQAYLRGTVQEDGTSTRILCRLGLHPAVAIFMALWFIGVWVMDAAYFVLRSNGLISNGNTSMDLVFGLMPFIFTIFGIGLLIFGRSMARNEGVFLLDFLRNAVEAREVARYSPAIER